MKKLCLLAKLPYEPPYGSITPLPNPQSVLAGFSGDGDFFDIDDEGELPIYNAETGGVRYQG